ncbi:hypothetical protein ABMA28_000577 [Loxostege sticticalis]|uniref:HTH CENPB-type domain-containing protein n=1 Tax=Loxostege sticticalis TaxID=481309 RepID=A0ABD0TST7_LOXSC
MPKPPTGKKYDKKYTEQELMLAIAAIKNGMPKKEAARVFNIPRATLQFRINNDIVNAKPGPPTVLTKVEEETIVEWIVASSKKGFPRRKEDVLHSVERFLEKAPRPNVFINNKPGEGWYKLFLKRHPDISSRTAEAVTSASANVSEQNIRKWFQQIENLLKEEQLFEILSDPNRIFNGDETGFQLCPKQGKVLAQKGARDVYEVDMAPAKSSITVMFTFSASGTITPPMVIFPLKRMRDEIRESVPSHWGVSLSETGWMTYKIFYQYITNVLHPYLISQNVVFPVILFLDGHRSHINYELSIKCKELGIVLIALYPNSTRILQPADVAAFRPIKNGWRKAVLEWRRQNIGKQMTKVDFGGVLNIVLEKHINSQVIKNGFRACGLYPWNADAINFSKCLGTKKQQAEVVGPQKVEKNLSITDFQRILGEDVFTKLINEVPEPQNYYHKAIFDIYKFFQCENNDNNSFEATEVQEQILEQDKLLIDDSWFPIDDIPILVSQDTDTVPTHMLNDDDGNIAITEEIDLDSRATSVSTQQIMTDIPESQINSLFLPNIDVNCNNMTERFVQDNSEENVQLADDNQLQNDTLENQTSYVEDQTVDKNDTAKNTETAKIELRDCLDWPLTPVRKGRILTEKPLYVLTAAKWLENEEIKRKNKEKLIEEKEQRKKLREATKRANAVQKENKKVLQSKKIVKKDEKEDVKAENCKETLVNDQYKRKSEQDSPNKYSKKQKTSVEPNIVIDKNKISTTKKIKILSIVSLPAQDNVKRKLFDFDIKENNTSQAKVAGRRTTFRNEKELQNFLNNSENL